MGLLDLQTDLKSLKYGQDRPNGGSSGQPYIQTDIRTVDATFGGANLTLYDDGLVRGGMVAAQNAAATDTLRIAKFFTDPPKGPLFLVKQVGLQLSNPQLERKGDTTERYIGPSRTYNLGINTLSQVPLTAFGEHIVRHGILPINDPDTYYESVVTANNFQNDGKNNRLLKYATKFTLGGEGGIVNKSWNDDLELNKYVSGPNSTYGIGNTIISRYNNTNDKSKIDAAFDRSKSLAGHFIDDSGNIFNNIENRFLGISNRSSSIFVSGDEFALGIPLTLDDRNAVNNINEDKLGLYKVTLPQPTIPKTVDFGISNQSGSIFNGGKEFNLINFGGSNTTTINDNTPLFNFVAKDGDKPQPFAGKSRETTDELKTTSTVDYGLSNKTESILSDRDFTDLPTQIIPNTPLPFYYATNADKKQHDRNGTLPAIDNKNDLVKNGPSSYPLVNNARLKQLDLEQTAYNFTNPNLKTYSTIANKVKSQTSKGTPLIHTNIGGSKYIYNAGTKVVFNRVNDTNVDKDTLAIRFKPVDPFSGQFLSEKLNFLAYLKDYKDTFDSTWNDIKYVGRAEKFYIFNEFKRSISFSFTIPCFKKSELMAKHSLLNKLVSITAGKYQGGLLGGVITYLTLGNYIANQPGIITNIGFNPVDGSSWDLDDKFAFYIDVSVSFTLIHDFLPEYNRPFINVKGDDTTVTPPTPPPAPTPQPPQPTPDITPTIDLPPLLINPSDYLGTGGGFERAGGNTDAQRAYNESQFGFTN
jgi:hypothetical protein